MGDRVTDIQFVGDHERFDGVLLLSNGVAQKVEMTAAINGHNNALQMELLADRGHAPAFQKIEAKGTKHNRQFGRNRLEAIASTDYNIKTLSPLLKQAVSKKIKKGQTNQEYLDAWLGVVFDDWMQPKNEKKKRRFDPICKKVLDGINAQQNPFARIFFVGVSRDYLFDSGLE